jgi:hypothetical protein
MWIRKPAERHVDCWSVNQQQNLLQVCCNHGKMLSRVIHASIVVQMLFWDAINVDWSLVTNILGQPIVPIYSNA